MRTSAGLFGLCLAATWFACLAFVDAPAIPSVAMDDQGVVWLEHVTARVEMREGVFSIDDPRYEVTQSQEEAGDAFGPQPWLVYHAEDEQGVLDLFWYQRQDDAGRLIAKLRFVNRSDQPLHVNRIVPIDGVRPGDWQGGRLLNGGDISVGTIPLEHNTDVKTYFAAATDKPPLTGGFLTTSHYQCDLFIRTVDQGLALLAVNDGEGVLLPPGGERVSDVIWLSPCGNPSVELEQWASLAGRVNGVTPRNGAFAVWCSWYAGSMLQADQFASESVASRLGTSLEQRVKAELPLIAQQFLPYGFNYARLVDDSIDRGAGDWNLVTSALPNGYPAVAEAMGADGVRAGFWAEPHRAQVHTRVFQQHPGWLAVGEDGKPLLPGGFTGSYGAYGIFDASQPEVRRYIRDSARKFREAGFQYCFLDFIFECPVRPTMSSNPQVTGVENMRYLLAALNEGFGPEVFLLSAPLDAGSYGMIDAMRVDGDSFGHYLPAYGTSLKRWFLNQRLFDADPDGWLPASHAYRWDRDWGSWLALYGGVITIGADMSELPPERAELIKRILPPLNSPGRPRDVWEREFPVVLEQQLTVDREHWRVVGLFNYGYAAPVDIQLNLDRLWDDAAYFEQDTAPPGHTDRRYLLYDFWDDRFLGEFAGSADFALGGMQGKVITVREAQPHPQILAIGTHIGQGIEELQSAHWDEQQQALVVKTRGRAGLVDSAVAIHVPEGWRVQSVVADDSPVDWRMDESLCRFVVPDHSGETQWVVSFDRIEDASRQFDQRKLTPGKLAEVVPDLEDPLQIRGGMIAREINFEQTLQDAVLPEGWAPVFYAHPEHVVFPYDHYQSQIGFGLVAGSRQHDDKLIALVSHGSTYLSETQLRYRVDNLPADTRYTLGLLLIDPDNMGRTAQIKVKNIRSGETTSLAEDVPAVPATAESGGSRITWIELPDGIVEPAGFEIEINKAAGSDIQCAGIWVLAGSAANQ